jgi:hypothetical protein
MNSDNQDDVVQLQPASRIVKDVIEVEIILHDGTKLDGKVFIGQEQRVQDLLNDANAFFPLLQPSGEILLIAKSAMALCKPLDSPG